MSAVELGHAAAERLNDGSNALQLAKTEFSNAISQLAQATDIVTGGTGRGLELTQQVQALLADLDDLLNNAARLQGDVVEWSGSMAR